MGPMLAIALKDMRQLARDRVGFFFVFIFPAMFGILFGLIFAGAQSGGPTGIPIGVVDEDGSASAATFIDKLDDSETFRITRFEARAEAFDAVRTGDRQAAIVVPEGFGAAFEELMFTGGIALEGAIDPARAMTAGGIEGTLTGFAFEMLTEQFTDPARARGAIDRFRESVAGAEDVSPAERLVFTTFAGALENLIDTVAPEDADAAGEADAEESEGDADGGGSAPTLVTIELESIEEEADDSPANAFEITFPQASAWGLLSVVTGFGVLLVAERQHGTMARLFMAPLTRRHVLAGKGLGCFLVALLAQLLLIGIGRVAFGVTPISWALVAVAVLSSCLAFVGLMIPLAVLAKTEAASEGVARAILLVLALIGGAGVPLAFMPQWVQGAASVSPFKWVIVALEGAIWRNYTFAEMLLPCGVLIAFGAACFVVGAALFRAEDATA